MKRKESVPPQFILTHQLSNEDHAKVNQQESIEEKIIKLSST
jgi:hypothetical protein